jgi:hypothetical protein
MHAINAANATKAPWIPILALLPVGVGVGAEELLVVALVSDRQSIAWPPVSTVLPILSTKAGQSSCPVV